MQNFYGSEKRESEMSLAETMHQLNLLLASLSKDLGKVPRGNRAAAQRVRVGTIRFEKIAKRFRKESVMAEKSGKLRRKKRKKKRR